MTHSACWTHGLAGKPGRGSEPRPGLRTASAVGMLSC